jgi:hypothetical protein
MAGLKKKKKEKSTSPNVILVVFLVLFVLVSIGLGVWGYSLLGNQEALRSDKKGAVAAAKAEKNAKLYYQMLWRDLRQAIGQKLDAEEVQQLELDRDEFLKPKGAFSEEKTGESAKNFMADVHDSLGLPKDAKSYDKNYMDELKIALAKIKEIEGKTAAEIVKHEATKKLVADLKKDQDLAYQSIKDKIDKENNNIFAKAKEQSDEFKKISDNNIKLNQDLAAQGEETSKLKDEHEKQIKLLKRSITLLEAEKKENIALGGGPNGAPAGPVGVNNMARGDLFPLLLDISPRKPLWDLPVGRVIRVDLDLRQVTINVGSAHGAKPELTFNVFGANIAGRAEKQMKGTIEIVKVLDTNSSTCRITSLYDSDGIEILMNLQTRGRILRETEAPMKEGDLLFNLFWGTRVAVAGYVSITGERVENPSEQHRQMVDFMALCKRNGMVVDAYVDLRDGQIKGKINSKTRYLIRGDALNRPGSKDAGPMKKDPDDKDKEMADKEPAREGGLADRIDQVNRSSFQLHNDARDKGLLLISAENFANVIGYQKARSANSIELSGFRPTLPYAGAPGEGGVLMQPERPPVEKEAPKEKEMEKKDEKKDAGN